MTIRYGLYIPSPTNNAFDMIDKQYESSFPIVDFRNHLSKKKSLLDSNVNAINYLFFIL